MRPSKVKAIRFGLALLALLTVGILVAPGGAGAFSGHRMWGVPINGKVGHHVDIHPIGLNRYKGTTSSQRGCYWGPLSRAVRRARCTRDLITSGSLPPGLSFRNCDSFIIAGTPTQPGVWNLTLRLPPFICPEGTTPPQSIEVRFNITGYAPRRVR